MSIDEEKVRNAFNNFRFLMGETAARHIEAGEDQAAGILLVVERRVYTAMQEYAVRVQYPPAPGATPGPPPPRRRSSKRKREVPEGEGGSET